MLLLKTEPLEKDIRFYSTGRLLNSILFVCVDRLHEYFDFPEGTPKIEIQIHDRPSMNRVALEREIEYYCDDDGVSVDGNSEILTYIADELLRPLFAKHDTLYAELHYWEH